ncbi:MAG: helix-turn-helix domain-containing protein [Mucilaginibacter polytrichastri]|nr:helix-turn-helix domain-containing protein [Mucilaginibacter polytrichastri]
MAEDYKDLLERILAQLERIAQAQPQPETWLDGQDVMNMLHISPRTLQTWRSNNLIPHAQINGKIFYRRTDIDAVLTALCREKGCDERKERPEVYTEILRVSG